MSWGTIIFTILLGAAGAILISLRREAKKSVIPLSEKEFITNMRKGQLIDLRKKEEFENAHINGARNIPSAILARSTGKIRKDLPIYLYCEQGKRSKRAAFLLKSKGYENIYQLDGGLENWSGALKTKKNK